MTQESSQDERAPLLGFVSSLKGNKQFEPHRNSIRVVNKGLFVESGVVDEVLKQYQAWIAHESNGVAQKTIEKCRQRLFEGKEPERQYLVEGKNVLAGYLISLPVTNPQQYGLPFYLGSLLPAQGYLHPADPVLKAIKGLEVRQGKGGFEAIVSRGERKTLISDAVLKSFSRQVQDSRYLQRKYPEMAGSLASTLRFLVGIVRRARPIPRSLPIIAPYEAKSGKKVIRLSGKFMLIEDRGSLLRVIELNGRNLSNFLREELARAPREKLGFFKLMTKHRDIMGYYEGREGRVSVHARAFAEFVEYTMRARDPREKFTGLFTAGECFERFSSFFQLSQPIERRKIDGVLKAMRIEGASFKMYGGWIFALSRERTVMRAVAKHIRLPGQRRVKD